MLGVTGSGSGGGGRGSGGSIRIRAVDKILKFLAGLEEGNFLRRNFDLFAGLGITAGAAAAFPGAEAAEAANLDLVAFLEGFDDAVENGLDDRLGLLAREFGDAQNLFDEVGLR